MTPLVPRRGSGTAPESPDGPPPADAERFMREALDEARRGLGRTHPNPCVGAVVVKDGHVLALEAVEGTDACIRRGAALGGKGVVVVKRFKPGQDERFDLPAVGPLTLQVMVEVHARVLAVEAGKTLLLEADRLLPEADRAGVTLLGLEPSEPDVTAREG